MEWLALWGMQQLAGFAFKPVLESIGKVLGDLTKEAGADFVKDFFKDSLKAGSERFQKDALAIAMGKAIAQFLYIFQQELEASGVRKADIQQYEPALQKFIRDKKVKAWLGQAFAPRCQSLDGKVLRDLWLELELLALPEDFSWKISRVYLNRVEDIIGESQELIELFEAKQLVDVNETTQHIAGVVPDFNLERYRESLRDSYGRLKLNAIDTTYSEYRVRLWSVFIPQNVREALPPSRYELPKDVQQRLQEEGLLEADVSSEAWTQYQELYLKKPVQPILDTLGEQDCPYAVILGDPGSGKSSLLQYLALDWAQKPTAQVPLLIELRQYVTDENKPKDFLEFFHQGKRKICELNQLQLHEQLESGNALVMFDGLDEIFDSHTRAGVVTEIIAFTNKYKQVRVIVTSRIVGYNSERLESADFRHFTLQDFDTTQVREFVNRWHKLAMVDETDRDRSDMRKRLLTATKDSPAIRELSGNPLLLTMMAILNRKQELPRKRADLYEESAKVLLHQWDIEYKKMQLTLDDVDLRAKQAMLRQIAYHMQGTEGGLKGNIIHRDDLETVLANSLKEREVPNPLKVAGQLIDQLRKRDFILCHIGNDYFAFVHRTFLEYFCATEFAERFSKRGTESGLTIDQLKSEVFGKHLTDESWHEVLRLIVGSEKVGAEFAGDIVEYLIGPECKSADASNLLLAADCYSEISSKVKIQMTSKLLLRELKAALSSADETVASVAISENEESEVPEGETPAERLRRVLEKRRKERANGKDYEGIARKIVVLFGESPEARVWLEDQALNHKINNVRVAIVKGIAAVDMPEVNLILIDNLGDVYYYQNRYEDAIAIYLKLNLSLGVRYMPFVNSYISLNQYDEAKTICNQWIEKEQKSSLPYSLLGKVYRASGYYDEAISAYNKVVELSGENSIFTIIPLEELGFTYGRMGQYQNALTCFEKALAINPTSQYNSSAFNSLALLYYDVGYLEEAITACQRAILLDGQNVVAHSNLGCLYLGLRKWEDAIESFQTAIELNPRNANAYRNLGILFLVQGDTDRAEQELTTAIQVDS